MSTRVVFDTSVLLRYLIRPSAALRSLIEDYWLAGEVVMLTAPELLAELEAVLARPALQKFVHADEAADFVAIVRSRAEMLPSLGEPPRFTRDRKDDSFVFCALAGGASHLVTADNDLLVLGVVDTVTVLTPEAFLAFLRSLTSA